MINNQVNVILRVTLSLVLGSVDMQFRGSMYERGGYRHTCTQTGKNFCKFLTRNNTAPERIKRANNNGKFEKSLG